MHQAMELRRAAPGHGRGCGVGPRTLPPLRPPSSTRPCTLNDRPLISFGTRPYIVRTHVYTGSSQTRVSRRQTWCETPPCPVHTRASYVRISSCSRCSNLGRLPQELAQVVLLDDGVHVPVRHMTPQHRCRLSVSCTGHHGCVGGAAQAGEPVLEVSWSPPHAAHRPLASGCSTILFLGVNYRPQVLQDDVKLSAKTTTPTPTTTRASHVTAPHFNTPLAPPPPLPPPSHQHKTACKVYHVRRCTGDDAGVHGKLQVLSE